MTNQKENQQKTHFIKKRALKLGFDKVGIAPAGPLNEEGVHLQQWLDRGYHATMNWMLSRVNERRDVHQYFPEANSVVSVAMNYFHGTTKGKLKVSNYAWGDDYHAVLKKLLIQLLKDIQERFPGVKGIVCVDTSPVMEKVWAQRGGLGWIGKHTNLISRDYGSWLFLGELILDCELEYDAPFEENLCGSCTACMDACPTDAIGDEYVLDANRCISYLTIEHRGELPEEIADQLYGWIYGCDICQEVCPWNIKFGRRSEEMAFSPRNDIVKKTVEEWESLTVKEYQRIFMKSAIKRAKFEGIKRNINANLLSRKGIL